MKTVQLIFIMGILSWMFGCTQTKIENKEKKTPLQTLGYAISDVGLWTWWVTDSTKSVQLEFDRAMLNFDNPKEGQPPSHRLALRFVNPISVTVLYKKESQLPNNWLELFNQDKLEPFSVDYEHFSFDHNEIKEIVKLADRFEAIIGEKYDSIKSIDNKIQLGFWAGEVGIVILADSMLLVNHAGKVPLDSIPEIHETWWNYWRNYWDLKDTKNPLPYDPLCEITIPATNQNMEKIKDNLKRKDK